MPNYRIVTSFISYTATATAEDSAFQVTNLSSYSYHPFRPWKASSNAGTVDVTFDLGSGSILSSLSTDPAIFLDVSNVTTLVLQANGSLSWGSPPWQATITLARNPVSDRVRGFFRFVDVNSPAVSYRYVNLRMNSQAPSSGYQYQLGTALFGTAQELLANPLYPHKRNIAESVIVNQFIDGGQEVLKMGPAIVELSLQVQAVGSSELDQGLSVSQLGQSLPFVLWDSVASASQYAYLLRHTAPRDWDEQVVDQYESTWTMRELV